MKPTWQRVREQPRLLAPLLMRERVIHAIRAFFAAEGFHEVETPLLVPVPSMEPYLEVFETAFDDAYGGHHRAFLTNSPEYAMKRIMVAGLPRIYQLCKAFRNGEDTGPKRNPEFTILEWYRAHADYTTIMRDCEELLLAIHREVRGTRYEVRGIEDEGHEPDLAVGPGTPAEETGAAGSERAAEGQQPLPRTSYLVPPIPHPPSPILHYQGMEVDLTPPWERLTMREAFARYAGVDLDAVSPPLEEAVALEGASSPRPQGEGPGVRGFAWDALAAVAQAKGYTVPPGTTWDEMLGQIYASEVEPHLGRGRPTILYDYPIAWAGLARAKADDPRYAERFEFYIAGVELGNAFSELTDAAEQRARLQADQAARAARGKKPFALDEDFLAALAAGLPPAGGIAVGVDRLVMLFADVPSIHETLWRPGRELFGPMDE